MRFKRWGCIGLKGPKDEKACHGFFLNHMDSILVIDVIPKITMGGIVFCLRFDLIKVMGMSSIKMGSPRKGLWCMEKGACGFRIGQPQAIDISKARVEVHG